MHNVIMATVRNRLLLVGVSLTLAYTLISPIVPFGVVNVFATTDQLYFFAKTTGDSNNRWFATNLDGSSPTSFTYTGGTSSSNAMEVDIVNDSIYWITGSTLKRNNLNGTNEQTFTLSGATSYYGRVILDPQNNRLYTNGNMDSDTETSDILVYNLSNRDLIRSFTITRFVGVIRVDQVGGYMYWTGKGVNDSNTGFYRHKLDGTGGIEQLSISGLSVDKIFNNFDLDPINRKLYLNVQVLSTDTDKTSIVVTDMNTASSALNYESHFDITRFINDIEFDPFNGFVYWTGKYNASDPNSLYRHQANGSGGVQSISVSNTENFGTLDIPYLIDVTAPDKPVISAIADDTGSSSNDGITSDTTLTVTGTAEADSTVRLLNGLNELGSTTATGGNWSIAATLTEGNYSLTATATDTAGNVSTASDAKTVTVDTTAPVISLVGSATVNVRFGIGYTDEGAMAQDNVDGTITGNVVTGGDTITTITPVGSHQITYDVTDTAGNSATQVIRTVNVRLTEDVNLDGIVSASDAAYVINRLNPGTDLTGDVTGDDTVTQADVDAVITALGSQ